MSGVNQDKVERSIQKQSTQDKDDVAEAISELMHLLGDDESFKMFSEVSNREIKHLSVLSSTGDRLMQDFIEEYLLLKISHNRSGRTELIDVSNAFAKLHELGEEENDKKKILNRIL